MTLTEQILALKYAIPVTPEAQEAKAGEYLTFTTKEEYLAWRKEWRALYATMTRSARGTYEPGDITIPWNSSRLRRFMMEIRRQSKLTAQQQYLSARIV